MRLFENLNFDFMGKRTIFYIVSSILLLFGLLNILFRGLEFGIDFKGGTEIAIEFSKPIDIATVRSEVDKLGLGNVEVKTFGGSTWCSFKNRNSRNTRRAFTYGKNEN